MALSRVPRASSQVDRADETRRTHAENEDPPGGCRALRGAQEGQAQALARRPQPHAGEEEPEAEAASQYRDRPYPLGREEDQAPSGGEIAWHVPRAASTPAKSAARFWNRRKATAGPSTARTSGPKSRSGRAASTPTRAANSARGISERSGSNASTPAPASTASPTPGSSTGSGSPKWTWTARSWPTLPPRSPRSSAPSWPRRRTPSTENLSSRGSR